MLYTKQPEDCLHINISKEVIYGTKTGDYICDDCGKTFAENPNKSKNS